MTVPGVNVVAMPQTASAAPIAISATASATRLVSKDRWLLDRGVASIFGCCGCCVFKGRLERSSILYDDNMPHVWRVARGGHF